MNTQYKIIEFPTNPVTGDSFAVITPLSRPLGLGRYSFPKWLPSGYTHMGTFKTLDEANARLVSLSEVIA